MRDVAQLAGVGKATVSLALRNDPRIRARTREKIQAAAQELGYRADAAVSQVMARLRAPDGVSFRGLLGVIDVASVIDRHGILPVQEVYAGCCRRAEELGYSLDLFRLNDPQISPSRLPKVIDSRGIRAVLFIGSFGNHTVPPETAAALEYLPSVAIDLSDASSHLHRADCDLYGAVFLAVSRMVELGYRRPGLVTFQVEDRLASFRLRAGYQAGCHHLSLPVLPICEIEGAGQVAIAATWFDGQRPDGLLIPEPAVREMFAGVPATTGFAVLDWNPEMIGWAGINRNRAAIGSAAIDLLSSQIQRNETGLPSNPKQILVGTCWTDGLSLPAVATGEPDRKKRAVKRTKRQ
jgi:DNA-binding LacI/PurR family transcriptional regulator